MKFEHSDFLFNNIHQPAMIIKRRYGFFRLPPLLLHHVILLILHRHILNKLLIPSLFRIFHILNHLKLFLSLGKCLLVEFDVSVIVADDGWVQLVLLVFDLEVLDDVLGQGRSAVGGDGLGELVSEVRNASGKGGLEWLLWGSVCIMLIFLTKLFRHIIFTIILCLQSFPIIPNRHLS